ncbi:hypothetical protein [Gordonia rhizosphera]|uniref:Uncharacterized protein n=1 Tax=Gordonia rhizosphera NBRC 16068 TaxID=1108045 RepID=K6UXN5_9ACTN|nr:hypothetical protein [Gordonia rhizosphera]GAB88158.1 hypothetical protein GORHZ_006_00270 [Gordonia rhizosphera NBRC 16068]
MSATKQGYTVLPAVLPVSALKAQATAIFGALEVGRVIYVSKYGQIVAAFRPYALVPGDVAALRSSPNLDLATLSASNFSREGLSRQIAAAEAGLPCIVEKDGHVYGMLTPARAPRPEVVPTPVAVSAVAEAILEYHQRNPQASIDDAMKFADSLGAGDEDGNGASQPATQAIAESDHDSSVMVNGGTAVLDVNRENVATDAAGTDEVGASAQAWPRVAASFEANGSVDSELDDWRTKGSDVEDTVRDAFKILGEAVAAGRAVDVHGDVSGRLMELGIHKDPKQRLTVLMGEQLESTDPVEARAKYVQALLTDVPRLDVGVMWRLGNLARHADNPAEAARWFRLAFACGSISG